MKRGQNDFSVIKMSSWNEYSDRRILLELMGFMLYFGCCNVGYALCMDVNADAMSL